MMQWRDNMPEQPGLERLFWFKINGQRSVLLLKSVLVALALSTLACGFFGGGSQPDLEKARLPTFTRTPLPALALETTPAPIVENPSTETEEGPLQPVEAAPDNTEASPADSAEGPLTSSPAPPPDQVGGSEIVQPTPTLVEQPSQGVPEGAGSEAAPAGPDSSTEGEEAQQPPPVGAENGTENPATPTSAAPAATPPSIAATPTPLPTPTVAPDQPAPGEAEDEPPVEPSAPPNQGSSNWTFVSTRLEIEEIEDELVIYGEVVNDTGSSQILLLISGAFYDAEGQIVADEDDTDDYTPVDIVPPGGRVPFEMVVYDASGVANYDLWVQSEASDDFLHQDFELSDVNQVDDEGDYCLDGRVKNLGAELQDYLVIVGVLYDSQDNVVNFGEVYFSSLDDFAGDETLDFEICTDSFNQIIARHELFAWGQ